MNYDNLLRTFWQQNEVNPIQPLDAFFYFYLLGECNKRNWINPFELRSRIIEVKLMISRKTIGEVRNRLKQRGLIDFVSAKNCPTIYRICAIGNSDNNSVSDCFPQGTIKKQLREQSGNISGNNPATSKEISPTPPKEIYPTTLVVGENNINIISTTRVREEGNLERFDRLLQEVVDGKHQIWEDQMRKKHGISNVQDYLPSFRAHVIANATVCKVADINGFKSYFNVAFRYFSRQSPMELLNRYRAASTDEWYLRYCDWLLKNAPNVAHEINPLTESELNKLVDAFSEKRVFNAILDINNRKDLTGKYFSLYRTLINWLERSKKT